MRTLIIIVLTLLGVASVAAQSETSPQARYDWALANCHARKFLPNDRAEKSWFENVTPAKWQQYQKSCIDENSRVDAKSSGEEKVAQSAPPPAAAEVATVTPEDLAIIRRLADKHFGPAPGPYFGSVVTTTVQTSPPDYRYCRRVQLQHDPEARGTVGRWWCAR